MNTRQKLLYTPLLVLLVVGGVSLFALDHYLQKDIRERVFLELQWLAQGALQVAVLNSLSTEQKQLDRIAKKLSSASGARITFINKEGKVLGDSNIEFEQLVELDDHSYRPEIQEAKRTGIGRATRYSTSTDDHLFYVAVFDQISSNDKGKIGFYARASLPLKSVSEQVLNMRLALATVGALSALILFLLSFLSSRWITEGINRDKRRLSAMVEARTQDIALLQHLGALLSACTEAAEAKNIIKSIMPQLLPNTSGAISAFKASRNQLDIKIHWGDEWLGEHSFAPNECWALRKGNTHYSHHSGARVLCEHMERIGEHSSICVPLMAQGNTIGVMHVINPSLEASAMRFLKSIAEQIGLTIANIELREKLQQQAIRDPLTTLYNRRYLLEMIKQLESRSDRLKSSVGVIMLDLDHFKRFNDTHGHDAGDKVLKSVADELTAATREGDTVCRFGGEEICIVCADSSLAETVSVANKLLEKVRQLEIYYHGQKLNSVTFSAGVVAFPEVADSVQEAIHLADKALYRAKLNGRNRIEMIRNKEQAKTMLGKT